MSIYSNYQRQIHNHMHIDLAGTVLPRTSENYLPLRHALLSAIFTTLITAPDSWSSVYVKPSLDVSCHTILFGAPEAEATNDHHSYIFTEFQSTSESGTSTCKKYIEAARRRGCLFVPIILTCSSAENASRMQSAERMDLVAAGKGLLLDTDVLESYRKRSEIYRFQTYEEMELDVTELTPMQAANRIFAHVRTVTGDE